MSSSDSLFILFYFYVHFIFVCVKFNSNYIFGLLKLLQQHSIESDLFNDWIQLKHCDFVARMSVPLFIYMLSLFVPIARTQPSFDFLSGKIRKLNWIESTDNTKFLNHKRRTMNVFAVEFARSDRNAHRLCACEGVRWLASVGGCLCVCVCVLSVRRSFNESMVVAKRQCVLCWFSLNIQRSAWKAHTYIAFNRYRDWFYCSKKHACIRRMNTFPCARASASFDL